MIATTNFHTRRHERVLESFLVQIRFYCYDVHKERFSYTDGLTENDGPSKLQGMKLQDVKMTDKNDGRARSCRRTNRVL